MSQASFQKRQREKARQERADAKAVRREARRSERSGKSEAVDVDAALLQELAELHQRYDAGTIELEEFLDAKDALTARLASS